MYTRSYTRCARFEAISTYNIAFTNTLTRPFATHAHSSAFHTRSTTFIVPYTPR